MNLLEEAANYQDPRSYDSRVVKEVLDCSTTICHACPYDGKTCWISCLFMMIKLISKLKLTHYSADTFMMIVKRRVSIQCRDQDTRRYTNNCI